MTKQEYLKHRDLIEEWAKGSKIEYYCTIINKWLPIDNPNWELHIIYRLEKPKPKWKDFGEISGYYIYADTDQIRELKNVEATYNNKSVFPTREEAEACLALSQLCQWRDKYNEGWRPDWCDEKQSKYSLAVCENKIIFQDLALLHSLLTFKSKEIRDKFLEDFRDLIETAKPLL